MRTVCETTTNTLCQHLKMDSDCYACRMTADDAPVRECFKQAGGWRVALSFNSGLEGWLVITPLRHVESLTELTAEEAASLGTLLRDASTALEAVTGCVKTYVMLFAEADGFAHVHFHIVPRMPDQPAEFKGPNVFGYLKQTPSSDQRRDEVAQLLLDAWPS